jgi:hypothetical protein
VIPQQYKHDRGCIQKFRTSRLEQELQMVELSATRCSYIAILWVNLVSFTAITLCVASQRVFIVVSVYFFIDSVRKFWIHPRTSWQWLDGGGGQSSPTFHCTLICNMKIRALQVPDTELFWHQIMWHHNLETLWSFDTVYGCLATNQQRTFSAPPWQIHWFPES